MSNNLNIKNISVELSKKTIDKSPKLGKIKLSPTSAINMNGVSPGPVSPTCFPAGSLVLMADLSWKAMEQVKLGELMWSVNGPTECVEEYVTTLGNRRMITFEDESILWSEEHLFWTKSEGKEWWWTYNADIWRWEVDIGATVGLIDNYSLRDGEILLEYAHLDGWKLQKSKVIEGDYNENTPLYLSKTNGEPIVVDGYLVTAGTNEFVFDYSKIKWDDAVSKYKKSLKESMLVAEF